MSNELLAVLRASERSYDQTKVKEVPGATGFTSFYAVGTWTPTYVGGVTPGVTTYSVQVGTWTRLGRAIFAYGRVVWTAATGTGNAHVSLPWIQGLEANK